MANANIARGLIPYRQQTGAPFNGAGRIYYVPSSYGTALYVGDPVIPTGTNDANGVPGIVLASAGGGNYMIGSVIGIANGGDPTIAVTRDMPVYHPASTAQYLLIADDPATLFQIQEDGNMGATATMGNADLVSGTGSTYSGYSGWQLSSASLNTTSTLQLRILELLNEADNAVGTNAKWLVRINLHSLTNTTGI